MEEGRGLQKEDVGITEQIDQGRRKTREQSVHMYPEDDKGIKQTAQIVRLCKKLTADEPSVLFWQGNQPCGPRGKLYTWITIVSHDILINKF